MELVEESARLQSDLEESRRRIADLARLADEDLLSGVMIALVGAAPPPPPRRCPDPPRARACRPGAWCRPSSWRSWPRGRSWKPSPGSRASCPCACGPETFVRELTEVLSASATLPEIGTLVFIKIVNLEELNTRLGYASGDEAVTHVGTVLKDHGLGTADIAGRIAGAGFCYTLIGVDRGEAETQTEQLVEDLSTMPAAGQHAGRSLAIDWNVYGLRSGEDADNALSSPLKKASLTGFHATAKHIAAKAVSPSSETMRTI